MKEVAPRCSECDFAELTGRANRNTLNRYNGGPRGYCYCKHPDAEECFKTSGSYSAACFIGFTRPGGCEPTIKTSPRWCPLRKRGGA